ncbi:protein kinase family protein, partial [Staphylococcus warneri]
EYKLVHEIYALTYLIYFVITGRERLKKTENKKFDEFVSRGTDVDITKRFKNISELKEKFINLQL